MYELETHHHHRRSVWMAAPRTPALLRPGRGVLDSLWSTRMSAGVKAPRCNVGSAHGGGAGNTGSQLGSAPESSRLPGWACAPLEGCEASEPKLNRKPAAICLHCYLCFKRVTGCQPSWGSLNLLPFRLLPQSLAWQVTSFKKHRVRMFPPLLFK